MKIGLFIISMILLMTLSTLVHAIVITTPDGVRIEFDENALKENPELRELVKDWTANEFTDVRRTEALTKLEGQGIVSVSGLQTKKNSNSNSDKFLSSMIIFVLIAVPLMILGYEIARKR